MPKQTTQLTRTKTDKQPQTSRNEVTTKGGLQTDCDTDRGRGRNTQGRTETQTERQTDRRPHRQNNKQKDREREKKPPKHTSFASTITHVYSTHLQSRKACTEPNAVFDASGTSKSHTALRMIAGCGDTRKIQRHPFQPSEDIP